MHCTFSSHRASQQQQQRAPSSLPWKEMLPGFAVARKVINERRRARRAHADDGGGALCPGGLHRPFNFAHPS